jgi:hypothetical protein
MREMKNRIENDYVKFEITDGILIATYTVKIITLEIAIEVIRFRKKFVNNRKFHALINDDNVVTIEKKARDFFTTDEAIEGISSVAILTNSIYKSALMNFFMKIRPTKMPIKIFNSKEKALLWLEENKKITNE